jgi:hypothetical protein
MRWLLSRKRRDTHGGIARSARANLRANLRAIEDIEVRQAQFNLRAQ